MNISMVLIVAFLCLAIGYLAGVLVTSLTMNRSTPDEDGTKTATDENKTYKQALLSRNKPGESLLIELDGASFSKANNLSPDQQKRLSTWAADVQTWLGLPQVNAGPDAAPREVTPLPPAAIKVVEIRTEPAAKPTQPVAPKSIVSQIDEILQEQINSSALAGRGIRLAEAPGEGVLVWIGLDRFAGIDAVTDAEVVSAIRSAVKTWEAKTK